MTAREFFEYLDEKGMADVPVLVQYRDELGDRMGHDVLGDDCAIMIDDDMKLGTVVVV